MTTPNRRRALVRKPSANPAWATLESLAVDYLALPPAPLAPAVDAPREQLRQEMLKRLMGAWVQMLADEVAAEVAEVADAGSNDATLPSPDADGASSEVPAHQPHGLEVLDRHGAPTLRVRAGQA